MVGIPDQALPCFSVCLEVPVVWIPSMWVVLADSFVHASPLNLGLCLGPSYLGPCCLDPSCPGSVSRLACRLHGSSIDKVLT